MACGVLPQAAPAPGLPARPAAAPARAQLQRGGQRLEGVLQDRDQVHRVPPGVRLFHAVGTRVTGDQAGEDRFGVLPARVVEGLERLVGEVGHVAGLEVAVVGGRREEEVGHLPAVGTAAEGRDEAALGPFGVPHLDEPAKPAP